MIHCGLDRVLDDTGELAGRRYALLAHAASVTADWQPAAPALAAAGAPPRMLFGPEHGFHGVEQDMVPAADARDPWTALPIRSLYGDSPATLRPDPDVFAGLDLMLIDLQDVGARYYTYAATAVWAAAAARSAGCEVWVLDRPNPLGGSEVEGNLRQPGFDSFVGAFALPARHGLTLGELVLLEGRERGWGDEVRVIPVEGWDRRRLWSEDARPWLAPSPNLPSFETALVYPGSCLIEATTLSEGRGTTRPFLLTGAPGLDGPALAARLEATGLDGVRFLPTFFRPQAQKHGGELCGGVRWVVTDAKRFRPYRAGVELLRALVELFPDFGWRDEPYEFETSRPAIDLLSGDSALREALESGRGPDRWLATWAADEKEFRDRRREVLLYPEGGVKRPHLLGVEVGGETAAAQLGGLLDALSAAGHRVGWLDLSARGEAPPELEAAASLPFLRAVAVGPERTATVKRRRGDPVLTDLLREHFLGCRLVLVRGAEGLPRLAPAGADWAVETPAGERLRRTPEQLAADLRKPDPW